MTPSPGPTGRPVTRDLPVRWRERAASHAGYSEATAEVFTAVPAALEALLTAEQLARILGVRPKRVCEVDVPRVRLSARSLRWRAALRGPR